MTWITCEAPQVFSVSKILKSFTQNERALKKYLRRFLSGSQDIEDAAQEAFLKAFATEIRTDVREPKALLFTAAKHVALNQIANKSNGATDFTEDLGSSDVLIDNGQANMEAQLDGRRKLLVVSQAIASLPTNCRQVFIMRKVNGLAVKEIAKLMNISVSGVEKHVATGLVKCSQFFRSHGYDPADFGPRAIARPKQETKVSKLKQTNDE